ncbi:TraB/GumN family protein [Fulvivirga maritima]|uniref:TraB/GumN family protein n=1 Tax=Fulvivirga maritima TaxID=2904247 RepID=UPI001F401176|nr:TraB/GumN family protein [Fulvivirga maritima]UII24913.1 TraB/GumN family protein [Fulvivirga maritima]
MSRCWFSLLFAILIALPSTLLAQSNDNYSLLWRIEGNELTEPSYLFGTMHVKDARAFNFSDSVMLAIQRSQSFALELHPDSMMNGIFNKYFEDDKNFQKLFDNDEYEAIDKKLQEEKGYGLDQLNVKNPIILKSLLTPKEDKQDDKSTFVDAYLYGIAKTLNKNIHGLEQVEDQTKIFYDAPPEEQKKEIVDILNYDTESYAKNLESMINIYSTGDLRSIEKMVESHIDSIFISRNIVMTNSMVKLMSKTPTFAAVGCAHLPGQAGLIQMLRDKGYKVSPVRASFTGVADNFKIDPTRIQWQTYSDDYLGYSMQMPGSPIPADIFPGLNMMMYPDLISGNVFFLMTIDMSGTSKTIEAGDITDSFIEGFKTKNSFDVKSKKRLNINGVTAYELEGSAKSGNMLMRIIVQNNIVFCQFISTDGLHNIPKELSERFFKSFRFFPPKERANADWITFSNETAGFETKMPFEPRESEKVYEDNNGVVKMYLASDTRNMSNYLIAYNDYPLGYFLEDPHELFKNFEEEYKQMGTLLSKPDSISLQNYKGMQYRVSYDNKYYIIARIYIRGNRVYKVIQQNLNAGENNLTENDFLSSFSFTPLKEDSLIHFSPEGESFSFQFFPEWKADKDSTIDYNTYSKTTDTYFLKSPNTGGAYYMEYNELSEYFKINHVDTFYTRLADNLLSWNDSLVQQKSITIDGLPGTEIVVLDKNTGIKKRERIWLDENHLFFAVSFTSDDQMFSPTNNQFFESYSNPNRNHDFDMYSSKTHAILESLASTDSVTYKKALGALNYYEFTTEDLPAIYQAIEKTYAPDSISDEIKSSLIQEIGILADSSSIEFLLTYYKNESATDVIKTNILSQLQNFDNYSTEEYLTLLTENPPHTLDNDSWKILNPLTDSLALTKHYFAEILPLLDYEDYRYELLSTALTMVNDSVYKDFITSQTPALLKYAFDDLNDYISRMEADTSENFYAYDGTVNQYLLLLNKVSAPQLTDDITTKLLKHQKEGWMRTNSITARIYNHLPYDKKEVDNLMESMNTRYAVMQSFKKSGQESKIPKKYKKADTFARTCLYEYLSYEGEIPDEIKILGTINIDNSTVYVFSCKYEDYENSYLALSGFYTEENPLDFKGNQSYSTWETVEDDWQKQAKEYIQDLRDYGY